MKTLSSDIIAKRFLRDQMNIMKRHGSAPKLTAQAYRQLLADTSKSFESLRPPVAIAAKRGR
jgi:hypothetical protein